MGSNLYCSPNWFYGYDILLEVLFAIVTLAVAVYAFRLYRISEQRELKLFGTSFIFISLSYSIWAILNSFAISQLSDGPGILAMKQASFFTMAGIYLHILLFLSGLVLLTYMTLKVRNGRVLTLIFTLTLLTVILTYEKSLIIYFLSSVLLLFICYHYFYEFSENKNKKVFPILLAFIFLFFARLDFSFSYNSTGIIHYVLGHILELIAYILIVTSLIFVIKHGKKAK